MFPKLRSAMVWLGSLCAAATVSSQMVRECYACLGEYRSPDWQVAQSPLVIIGEIERVGPGRVPSANAEHESVLTLGGFPMWNASDTPQGTIATVRIMRILKGAYPKTHVDIGSGPIRSCAPYEVHCGFAVGEQLIFILPTYPVDGKVAMVWGRSMLGLTATELIESRIARGKEYRNDYLREIETAQPKVYVAAVELARQMRRDAKTWPAKNRDKKTGKSCDAFEAAVAKLENHLSQLDVETIRTAEAIDWLSIEPKRWWENDVWRNSTRNVADSRKAAIAEMERRRIHKVLTGAGVETDAINNYLAVIKPEDFDTSLRFPPSPPHRLSKPKTAQQEAVTPDSELTTDFILCYHSYNRGAMVPHYAGGFSAEVLKGLDAKRAKPIIASLCHSNDERLRWLSHEAIGYVPGTEFNDLVLHELLTAQTSAWRILVDDKNPKTTSQRLATLIDSGSENTEAWEAARMWDALGEGQCFEPVCIEKALTALETLEQKANAQKSKKVETDEEDEEAKMDEASLVEALQRYLAVARIHREDAKLPKYGAAEYREWFKENLPRQAAP